jgi:hypothetical protein
VCRRRQPDQTFKYRQSSLAGAGAVAYGELDGSGCCMHWGPKVSAFFTPLQAATGCGAFQRRSPTGGAANGMPL